MRLTRCHVALPLAPEREILLPEATAHHLLRALRLREGDACVLFNGDGQDYHARIIAASKRETRVLIERAAAVNNESPLTITLIQAIARGEKMDFILQKATELGVGAIIPVHAEHTGVKLDMARCEKRIAHWRGVILAACAQSGRARVPHLTGPMTLQEAVLSSSQNRCFDGLYLTLDPRGQHRLATLPISHASGAMVAIGPEGGWSGQDHHTLATAGFLGLRLGPRILRTETAGLAAIAALQARCGDL